VRRLCLSATLALAVLAMTACQSLLGIDTNRPLVTSEASDDAGAHLRDDAAPPLRDAGNDATSGADGATAPDGGDVADTGSSVDGSALDSGGDAAPPPSLTNPVQIDVSAYFNANTVVTTTVGGAALTPMDGTGTDDNNDFPTQSEVVTLSSTGRGLPDDAFFASNGTSIPNVQLGWNNSSNVPNSVVASSTSSMELTFDVPEAAYTQVQLYATGAGGASTLNYSFTYADSSVTSSNVSLPDWCVGTPGSGQYVLVNVDRVENGATFNSVYLCNIYALDLNPDTGKALKSVSIWDTGGATTYLVFYGATAW
jgi:hypothetical protein